MLGARRAAVAPARQLLRRQPRRFDSHSSHGHDSHGAEHHGPVNESFGKGFYISVAAVPVSFALYQLGQSNTDDLPFISRIIDAWTTKEQEWTQRNSLHSAAVQQAAMDRHLFQSESTNEEVNLRYPEIFNTGSPWNIAAGEGGADLSKLIAHYEKKNKDAEASRLARMKDGKVVSVYDS